MIATLAPTTGPSQLHWETISDTAGDFLAEAAVARGDGLIRGVALLGPESRNGYRYCPQAMQAAAPLYADRPLFIDHSEQAPTRRKLRDFAGQVLNPRYEKQRLRGDLKLLGPNAGWLFDLIEAAPREVGLSHVILGRRSGDGQTVEQIDKVLSVDIVAFPATTQTFKEHAEIGCSAAAGCPLPTAVKRQFASLRQRVQASRLPADLHAAALEQLLAHPEDAARTLAALENFWMESRRDLPANPERCDVEPSADDALRRTIRGF